MYVYTYINSARSKAYVCGRLLDENVGSSPTVRHGCLSVLSVVCRKVLCDELITRPEECYRLWCVFVCDLATS